MSFKNVKYESTIHSIVWIYQLLQSIRRMKRCIMRALCMYMKAMMFKKRNICTKKAGIGLQLQDYQFFKI